jgi:site-specific DNA recombinase
MTNSKRALGVVRLSVLTDETTSPERQREIITAAAGARGSGVVSWAEDLDVSATKVHPFKRPALARHLEVPESFDEIIVWRIDRIARKVADFADLIRWCEKHGKGLVSASESFDLTTPMGKAMAYLIAIFAEMEGDAIRQRVISSRQELRQQGRFAGGAVPYGYRAIRNPDGPGQVLVPDPDTAPVAREAARRIIAGDSLNAVCAVFNDRGIPAPKGGRWRGDSLGYLLKSPALTGTTALGGTTVRGADGMPLQRAESLVDAATAAALAQVLAGRAPVSRRVQKTSLLLGIAWCGEPGCDAPLWKWQGGGHGYYRCSRTFRRKGGEAAPHKTRLIRFRYLEELAEEMFLQVAERAPVMRKAYDPGTDHAAELKQARQTMEEIEAEVANGELPAASAARMLATLEGRITELSGKPGRPAGWHLEPTGKHYGELWQDAGTAERRRLMLESGFRLSARPGAVWQSGELGSEMSQKLAELGSEAA